MEESATLRERRRLETERRITACAQRLTNERGLDGFTMDELAEAAELSRRTLFNYFPSKIDAVLGKPPEIPPAVVATFLSGGPHGQLVEDLGELVRVILDDTEIDRERMEAGRQVVLANPRLILAVHERFEEITSDFVDMILAREGVGFGAERARLVIRLLVTIFDCCLPFTEIDPARSLPDDFTANLRAARELFA
ncbi:TetR/AcrR family transcriptional regulator [Nocardioides sp. cx-173]|uniref:TetR/AcrR family transcriptional regulator n=1 Tax=Nocardioides sp. cx-173 TaxID=2898796 RepID=UPI001E414AAA|nr:TetR family transcriptional regulator [Nocardioides sp. cx-173]MCD4523670.1 TetR/AcrR family transcriptional regulator [Nocardioides sp. cx-173]UGB42000.1 TetR/AcrR family transcriptional regulator [Nocardioides sp. cx-173]